MGLWRPSMTQVNDATDTPAGVLCSPQMSSLFFGSNRDALGGSWVSECRSDLSGRTQTLSRQHKSAYHSRVHKSFYLSQDGWVWNNSLKILPKTLLKRRSRAPFDNDSNHRWAIRAQNPWKGITKGRKTKEEMVGILSPSLSPFCLL